MATKHLMQGGQVVSMQPPATTNGGFNSGELMLTNAQDAFIVAHVTNAAGHATQFSLQQDDGTGTWSAVPVTQNVWVSENVATTAISRQANAVSYTVDANISNKIIIFRVNPDSLSDGFNRVRLVSANSGEATNFASVVGYHLPARYS